MSLEQTKEPGIQLDAAGTRMRARLVMSLEQTKEPGIQLDAAGTRHACTAGNVVRTDKGTGHTA